MTEIDFPQYLPLGPKDIEKIIPHRYPFLLVDRVIELEGGSLESRVGRRVVGIKNITYNEPQFTGHFPQDPIFPGVMITEACAQVAAMAVHLPSNKEPPQVYIASINGFKFRKPVIPGDQLVIQCICNLDKKGFVGFDCKAEVDGTLVASGEFMARVFENGNT